MNPTCFKAARALSIAPLAAFCLALAAQTAPPPAKPYTSFVYTANQAGNTVGSVDLSTGQAKQIATQISPRDVQVSKDGRLLLVVGRVAARGGDPDANPNTQSRLLVFETATMTARSPLGIQLGRNASHVIIDGPGAVGYVTNSGDNNLAIVDLNEKKVMKWIRTGRTPQGLRMSPDSREIYVANAGDGNVSVVDVGKSREVARIPVGRDPAHIVFTPDGRYAYVALSGEARVAVIDTRTRELVSTVPVGQGPAQMAVTPDGRQVYVANKGTPSQPGNTVSVIDTASNSTVGMLETGRGAHGVVVSDDGNRVYVSNTGDGSVAIVDTAAQSVVKTVKVGGMPHGIAFRGPQP